MPKIIDKKFFDELVQELYQSIDDSGTNDSSDKLAKSVSLTSAYTFMKAYNKLIKDGYLDD